MVKIKRNDGKTIEVTDEQIIFLVIVYSNVENYIEIHLEAIGEEDEGDVWLSENFKTIEEAEEIIKKNSYIGDIKYRAKESDIYDSGISII